MKSILFCLSLIISASLMATAQASTGFIGSSITEYDLTGCQRHSEDPRCKQIIKVACRSICMGHFEEQGDFGHACNDLCHKDTVKNLSAQEPIEKPSPQLQ